MGGKIRIALTVEGRVQGVGFRPFIWRLARDLRLTGFVRNTSEGVRLEVQGTPGEIADFEKKIIEDAPPLAGVSRVEKQSLTPLADEDNFVIKESIGHGSQAVLVSPDIGVCLECLEDIRQPGNRRYGHAFANCTNCGPRFTITRSIPYDRPSTSMGCFQFCPACAREYSDPADRRFHAQPIACPQCGPRLWYARPDGQRQYSPQGALENAARLILTGGIVALKGMGGYQLACNARDSRAVEELRRRKHRPHKALAVMVNRIEDVEKFCALSPTHKKLLLSPEKPIVLCPIANNPLMPLDGLIAPDCANIGVMLPSTPLHALLFDLLEKQGLDAPCLVMTSANATGEPICLGNREAIARLHDLADAFLAHDRDILARVDDSVLGISEHDGETAPFFIRRARGYTPLPVKFADNISGVLGTGAELKSTFCLTRSNLAFTSQHIGDLNSPPVLAFYREALDHMQKLLETAPTIVVHDLHPDFLSTRFALELARDKDIPSVPLQHHAAHAASALSEHGCLEPALALCLDGTGLGDDGSIWGGELLLMDLGEAAWRRLGGLGKFLLPGGEAAILQPWRIACALREPESPSTGIWSGKEENIIREMIAKDLNCPQTSSCGRLFDAISARLGLCREITYEGQAAIRLEKAAIQWLSKNSGKVELFNNIAPEQHGEFLLLNPRHFFSAIEAAIDEEMETGKIAASFHYSLALAMADLVKAKADELRIGKVALSGGVMQNSILIRILPEFLRDRGLEPLYQRSVPAGDGGISPGQAAWGQRLIATHKIHI